MVVTTQVAYAVLGPLEVHRGGHLVEVTRPKLRGLLGLLLLERNRVVSRSQLIDALWGEDPPATVDAALHSLVSEARRRVVGSDALTTQAPGYLLRVEPDALDLARFEQLHDQARQALGDGRPDEALRLSDEALALWRGEPLADCPFDEAVRGPMVASIKKVRMAVLEDQFEAALACGRHREVVGELERLVDEDPLRERLRGLLMIALYRSGRPSEALAVYRDGYTAMADSLGIAPSPALQALERAILQHDPSLDGPTPPAQAPRSPTEGVAPPRQARRILRPVVAAILLTAIVAIPVAAVVISNSPSNHRKPVVGPYAAVPRAVLRSGFFEIDPTTNRVVRTVAYHHIQDGEAIGFGARWIATAYGVEKVDPTTGKILAVVQLPAGAQSVAVAGSLVWATSKNILPPSYVYAIQPNNPTKVLHQFKVGGNSEFRYLFSGAGNVWELGASHLTEINPNNPTAMATIPAQPIQPELLGVMTFGAGAAWIMDENAPPPGHSQGWGTLYRINPRSHRITARIAIPNPDGSQDSFHLTFGAGAVWVADGLRGVLWEVNPTTGRSTQPIHQLPPFDTYAVRPGELWILNGNKPHLVEIQLGNGAIINSYPLPGGPKSIRFVNNLLQVSYGGGD